MDFEDLREDYDDAGLGLNETAVKRNFIHNRLEDERRKNYSESLLRLTKYLCIIAQTNKKARFFQSSHHFLDQIPSFQAATGLLSIKINLLRFKACCI